jgi:hypothetical protein
VAPPLPWNLINSVELEGEAMSIATAAQALGSNASLFNFGHAFEAWCDPPDPPASEAFYQELIGEQIEPEGLDASLDVRILSL